MARVAAAKSSGERRANWTTRVWTRRRREFLVNSPTSEGRLVHPLLDDPEHIFDVIQGRCVGNNEEQVHLRVVCKLLYPQHSILLGVVHHQEESLAEFLEEWQFPLQELLQKLADGRAQGGGVYQLDALHPVQRGDHQQAKGDLMNSVENHGSDSLHLEHLRTRVQQVEAALVKEEDVPLVGGNLQEGTEEQKLLASNSFWFLSNLAKFGHLRGDAEREQKQSAEGCLRHLLEPGEGDLKLEVKEFQVVQVLLVFLEPILELLQISSDYVPLPTEKKVRAVRGVIWTHHPGKELLDMVAFLVDALSQTENAVLAHQLETFQLRCDPIVSDRSLFSCQLMAVRFRLRKQL